MKKIVTFILLMAVAAVYAQSFQITYNGEPVGEEFNYIVEEANDDNELIFVITNTSSEEISISLSRRVISEVPGSYNIFCFGGGCYDSQNQADNPMVLQPGETSEGSDFHFVYNPCGNEGTTSVNYSFTSADYSVSVEHLHLVVDFDAEGLEHLRQGLVLLAVGQERSEHVGQVGGGADGRFAARFDAGGDLAGVGQLPVLVEEVGQGRDGIAVHHLGGGETTGAVHPHVEIALKTV